MQHRKVLTEEQLDALTVQVFNSAGTFTMTASVPDGRDVVIVRVEPDSDTEVCLRVRLPAVPHDSPRNRLRAALVAAERGLVALLTTE